MRRIGRALVALVVAALVLACAALVGYRAIEQPKVDGTLTVPGLAAPVDIVRDVDGVPHIHASRDDDAWFALGFVHAQDRLWQMELNRRIAAGRVAEILGEGALETDRFIRTLGVARNAAAIASRLDEPTRRALERYAAGVNANVERRRRLWPVSAPVEFVLTGSPVPEAWTPADSIGWVTMMAWDLSGNWSTELMRLRLSARLSKRQIDELLPPYPGKDPAGPPDAVRATADYVAWYRSLKDGAAASLVRDTTALLATAPMPFAEGKGSNNWVVSGARTASGKPLLANDPHLGLTAPSIWYLAQVTSPYVDVIGATLPGVPFVVIGRNRRVGWGLTNTGPDTQDLYLEELRDGASGVEARTPDGWSALEVRHETIRVKGRPDVPLTIRASRHGPLISDASRQATTAVNAVGARYALAFQWAALRPDDTTMQAGFALDRARDWTTFIEATRAFHAPQQNFVYADVDGTIGFTAPGRVPRRKPGNDFGGQIPAPGWDARYDWDGFVAFDDLPRVVDPAAGRVVTANQKVVADGDPVFLTSEWAPPFRAQRIEQLIDETGRHDVASFARIQADTRSLAVVRLLPLLVATPVTAPAAKDALAKLSAWDGTMAAERTEPLVFAAWMRELTRLVMRDELGDDLFADYWDQRSVFMINVLSDRDGQSRWCDDVTTPAVETCAQMQARALDLALADLAKRIGPDRETWRWGQLHVASSDHRPFARIPALATLFNLRTRVGGDTNTVNVGGYTIRNEAEPFVVRHGPSLREVLDFSDLERSRFIQATGQSGDRLSWFYGDFNDRWRDGATIPMRLDRAANEAGAIGTLRLSP